MNSNQLPLSGGVAIFFAVIIGYFVIDPSALDGFRPGGDSSQIEQVHGIEDVQARLWQDPFAAAAAHKSSYKIPSTKIQLAGKTMYPAQGSDRITSLEMTLGSTDFKDKKSEYEKKRHSLKVLLDEIKKEAGEASSEGVTVLAVMVSAGPYPKDAETRKRMRYAVLSALGTSLFYPKDREHIAYVDDLNTSDMVDDYRGLNMGYGEEQLPVLMPYEWYEKKDGQKDNHVLLLWLDEDAFSVKPLSKLDVLFASLEKHALAVKLVGPYGTGTLKEMVRGYKPNVDGTYPFLGNVAVYSATATGSANIKRLDDSVFRSFQRTIATDAKLMPLIVDELAKRIRISSLVQWFIDKILGDNTRTGDGRDFTKSLEAIQRDDDKMTEKIQESLERIKQENSPWAYQIALISEWDTAYGRALPDVFEKVLCKRLAKAKLKALREVDSLIMQQKEAWAKFPRIIRTLQLNEKTKGFVDKITRRNIDKYSRLHARIQKLYEAETQGCDQEKVPGIYRFSYMRGIDGVVAGEKLSGDSEIKKKGYSGEKDTQASLIDRPEGRSQKDYLRRLADYIARTDKNLKSKGEPGIRAIGVLGSDVYDKLLILRVLRERFPKAVFFTTDLDAALLHPDQFRWTRNMVVASGYDLRSDDMGEQETPPFRDSYQTSVYLATMAFFDTSLSHSFNIEASGYNNQFSSILGLNPNVTYSSPQRSKPLITKRFKEFKPHVFEIGRDKAVSLLQESREVDTDWISYSRYTTAFLLFAWLAVLFWMRDLRRENRDKLSGFRKYFWWFLVADFVISVSYNSLINLFAVDPELYKWSLGSALQWVFILYAYVCIKIWRIRHEQDKDAIKLRKYAKLLHLAVGLGVIFFSFLIFSDEPASLFSGVSIWPTEFIRLVAVWLAFFLLWRAWEKMRAGGQEIEKELDVLGSPHMRPHDIRTIWSDYQKEGSLSSRFKRIRMPAVIWLMICLLIFKLQSPNIPFRGTAAYLADVSVEILAIVGFFTLFCFVVDAVLHCRREIIQVLIDKNTRWPFMRFKDNGVPKKAQILVLSIKREWKEIRLIAMRTDDISKTVYYPIYVILLLLAAQSDYFDNWDMPYPLVLIATVNVSIVLWAAIMLRRSAVEARNVSLDKVRHIESKALAIPDAAIRKQVMRKLKFYKTEIENIREGAFLPISEQPWLRALTLMGGGGGSLLLLQAMAG